MAPRPPNPNHPLVKARERVGYQQKDAALALDISPNTLGRYERGDRRPGMNLLSRMATLYRVPLDALLLPASVPRETSQPTTGRVTEPTGRYGLGRRRDALWAIEQMSLALADIARRARIEEEE